jgi:hypothetical protein
MCDGITWGLEVGESTDRGNEVTLKEVNDELIGNIKLADLSIHAREM